jgi:hypothetical protein
VVSDENMNRHHRRKKERLKKYLDQEIVENNKKRSEMKSSVMNVQVDVTFYKKTFLFSSLSLCHFSQCCAESRMRS